jgi:hypothetical protein
MSTNDPSLARVFAYAALAERCRRYPEKFARVRITPGDVGYLRPDSPPLNARISRRKRKP